MKQERAPILERLDALLEHLGRLAPAAAREPDWKATAFRWRKNARGAWLEAVRHPHTISFADLVRPVAREAHLESLAYYWLLVFTLK